MTKYLRYLACALLAAALAACNDDSEFFYTTAYPVVRIEAIVTVKEEPVTPEPEPEPEPTPEPEPGTGEGEGNGDGNETGNGGEDETGNDSENNGRISGGIFGKTLGTTLGRSADKPYGTALGRSADKTPGIALGRSRGKALGTALGRVRGETREESGEEPENPWIKRIGDEVLAAAPVQGGGSYLLEFKYYNNGRLTVTPAAGAETISGGFAKTPGASDIRFYFNENAYQVALSSYAQEDGTEATLFTVDLTAEYQALYPEANITRVLRLEYTSHRE